MIPVIQVSSLPASTSFYADILQPLGLKFVPAAKSKSEKPAASGSSSHSVFFGLSSKPLIELKEQPHGESVSRGHLVLASSIESAVSEFHTRCSKSSKGAAMPASASTASRSKAQVPDLDGNMVEVVYQPDSAQKQNTRVLNWNYDVAKSGTPKPGSSSSSSKSKASPSVVSKASTSVSKASTSVSKASTSVSKASTSVSKASTSMSKATTATPRPKHIRHHSAAPTQRELRSRGHKIPVGEEGPTLLDGAGAAFMGFIGVAAGAAMAYSMMKNGKAFGETDPLKVTSDSPATPAAPKPAKAPASRYGPSASRTKEDMDGASKRSKASSVVSHARTRSEASTVRQPLSVANASKTSSSRAGSRAPSSKNAPAEDFETVVGSSQPPLGLDEAIDDFVTVVGHNPNGPVLKKAPATALPHHSKGSSSSKPVAKSAAKPMEVADDFITVVGHNPNGPILKKSSATSHAAKGGHGSSGSSKTAAHSAKNFSSPKPAARGQKEASDFVTVVGRTPDGPINRGSRPAYASKMGSGSVANDFIMNAKKVSAHKYDDYLAGASKGGSFPGDDFVTVVDEPRGLPKEYAHLADDGDDFQTVADASQKYGAAAKSYSQARGGSSHKFNLADLKAASASKGGYGGKAVDVDDDFQTLADASHKYSAGGQGAMKYGKGDDFETVAGASQKYGTGSKGAAAAAAAANGYAMGDDDFETVVSRSHNFKLADLQAMAMAAGYTKGSDDDFQTVADAFQGSGMKGGAGAGAGAAAAAAATKSYRDDDDFQTLANASQKYGVGQKGVSKAYGRDDDDFQTLADASQKYGVGQKGVSKAYGRDDDDDFQTLADASQKYGGGTGGAEPAWAALAAKVANGGNYGDDWQTYVPEDRPLMQPAGGMGAGGLADDFVTVVGSQVQPRYAASAAGKQGAGSKPKTKGIHLDAGDVDWRDLVDDRATEISQQQRRSSRDHSSSKGGRSGKSKSPGHAAKGRYAASEASSDAESATSMSSKLTTRPPPSDFNTWETDTVVPNDSISCVGR